MSYMDVSLILFLQGSRMQFTLKVLKQALLKRSPFGISAA